MTTKRIHQCNFCRADIKDQDGIGLRWRGNALDAGPMIEAENHLCGPCAGSLAEVLERLYRKSQAA